MPVSEPVPVSREVGCRPWLMSRGITFVWGTGGLLQPRSREWEGGLSPTETRMKEAGSPGSKTVQSVPAPILPAAGAFALRLRTSKDTSPPEPGGRGSVPVAPSARALRAGAVLCRRASSLAAASRCRLSCSSRARELRLGLEMAAATVRRRVPRVCPLCAQDGFRSASVVGWVREEETWRFPTPGSGQGAGRGRAGGGLPHLPPLRVVGPTAQRSTEGAARTSPPGASCLEGGESAIRRVN